MKQTDRKLDIAVVRAKLAAEKMFRRWLTEHVGKRGRAVQGRGTGPNEVETFRRNVSTEMPTAPGEKVSRSAPKEW